MGNLINVIAKYIQGLLPGSKDSSEKTTSSVMIQLVLVCILAIPYAFTFLPPGVTVMQVITQTQTSPRRLATPSRGPSRCQA